MTSTTETEAFDSSEDEREKLGQRFKSIYQFLNWKPNQSWFDKMIVAENLKLKKDNKISRQQQQQQKMILIC